MPLLFTPQTRLYLAWFSFIAHLSAIGAMLTVLIPALPPGHITDRQAYVANVDAWWVVGWSL